MLQRHRTFPFFFFNDTATTEIYTLSLHDALPISTRTAWMRSRLSPPLIRIPCSAPLPVPTIDRKSTRLNSSHGYISYAVFCLKKKKNITRRTSSVNHATAVCGQRVYCLLPALTSS